MLFRPICNNSIGLLEKAITPDAIYQLFRRYSADLDFEICAPCAAIDRRTNGLIVRAN